ncbi:Transcriptional regulator [Fructobacillus fructosus]|uniref:Contains XRE-family HTH domain (HipB) n=1 Tax=Fructobacillus fructosus TaxID=1631 RepID=A0ABN9YWT0_9LACO|nr:Transcriptional regulator [Fructobacillus fructosus]
MKEGLGVELTERQIQVIKDHKESYSFNELAELTGVNRGVLVGIRKGERTRVSKVTYARLANKLYHFDNSYNAKNELEAVNRVSELREELGLTDHELAEQAGIGIKLIRSVENQYNEPSPATWQKLADLFGVWVGYLVGATDRRVR